VFAADAVRYGDLNGGLERNMIYCCGGDGNIARQMNDKYSERQLRSAKYTLLSAVNLLGQVISRGSLEALG